MYVLCFYQKSACVLVATRVPAAAAATAVPTTAAVEAAPALTTRLGRAMFDCIHHQRHYDTIVGHTFYKSYH